MVNQPSTNYGDSDTSGSALSPQRGEAVEPVGSLSLSQVPVRSAKLSPLCYELELPSASEDISKPKSELLRETLEVPHKKRDAYVAWAPSVRTQEFVEEIFRQPLSKSNHAELCRLYPRPQVETLMVPQVDDFFECLGNMDALKKQLPIEGDLQNHLRNFIDAAGSLTLMLHHLEKGPLAHDLVKHITCQSLRLLGHAIATLNRVRREAILKKVGLHKFLSVAAKGPSKGTGLFSEDLRVLLRERTEDAKALLGASKLARETTYSFAPHKRGSATKRPASTVPLNRPYKRQRQFFSDSRPFQQRTKGRFPAKPPGSQVSQENPRQAGQRSPAVKVSPGASLGVITFLGGNISSCLDRWKSITSDRWVLETVQGYKIPFLKEPLQQFPPSFQISRERVSALDTEIQLLLQKRAVEIVPEQESQPKEFLSTLFVVPKKDGGLRPVFNLRNLNSFLEPPHFKMEGIHTLKELIQKGDYMGKIDLKDAYLSIPIAKSHRNYLRFLWKGIKYQFSSLPFGLATAPLVFTKLLKPVVSHLRQQGIRLIVYLDDFLFLNQSSKNLVEEMSIAKSLLESLGFTINQKKSIFAPSKTVEFLGLNVKSELLQLSLPANKLLEIKKECQQMLTVKSVKARKIAHLVGKMVAAKEAINYSMAHLRYLQRALGRAIQGPEGFEEMVQVPKEACEDLSWWIENLQAQNGRSIQTLAPDLIIQTDASLSGWGAVCGGSRTGGLWLEHEKTWHINVLELQAIYLALNCFTKNISNQHILIKSDNVSALSYINRQGGTKSKDQLKVVDTIWEFCQLRQLTLTGEHVPGILNGEADCLSRHWDDVSD